MITSIIVRTRFEACHQWKEAPEEVFFLRSLHRHEFHVMLQLEVSHSDRELEFILVKRWLDSELKNEQIMQEWMSCEHLAKEIHHRTMKKYGLRSCKIEVSEDGENGAVIEEVI